MAEMIVLAVEDFPKQHPALNSALLVEHARVALATFHSSPALFQVYFGSEQFEATIHFEQPQPLSARTLEREEFVEKGAIVLAGLLLARFEGKQITDVALRGQRIDYFVGESSDDRRWLLEVSGTDHGNALARRQEKRQQLQQSCFHGPPFRLAGFVAVSRFAPPAATILELVLPKEKV